MVNENVSVFVGPRFLSEVAQLQRASPAVPPLSSQTARRPIDIESHRYPRSQVWPVATRDLKNDASHFQHLPTRRQTPQLMCSLVRSEKIRKQIGSTLEALFRVGPALLRPVRLPVVRLVVVLGEPGQSESVRQHLRLFFCTRRPLSLKQDFLHQFQDVHFKSARKEARSLEGTHHGARQTGPAWRRTRWVAFYTLSMDQPHADYYSQVSSRTVQ